VTQLPALQLLDVEIARRSKVAAALAELVAGHRVGVSRDQDLEDLAFAGGQLASQ
jgi:hypothetical protein